jgi:hypothetical protein
MKQTSKIIIYLDRQKITIAAPGHDAPVFLDFPVNVVYDIEIIDPEALETLLTDCFKQNKIDPSEVIIVLSPPVYYEKDAQPAADPAVKKDQIDAFLQTVPYKNLFFKDYILGDRLKLVTLNKDFYEPVIRILEKHRFNVIAILPADILDYLHLTLTQFSSKEVNAVYQQSKLILPYSLISAQDIDKSLAVSVHRPVEDKARTSILLILFCLLWVILLALIFIRPILLRQSFSQQLQKSMAALPTANPPTPTTAGSIAPASALLSPETVRIEIVNRSGNDGQTPDIENALTAAGFKQVTAVPSTPASGTKALVNYSSAVPDAVLQKLLPPLETIVGEVTSQATENLINADIIITTFSKPLP